MDNPRAAEAEAALHQLGLEVPGDVSLVGGCNVLDERETRFTGLCDRFDDVCAEGGRLLCGLIEGDSEVMTAQTVTLHPILYTGVTTAPNTPKVTKPKEKQEMTAKSVLR